MRVLVTGGSGFTGRRVVRHAVQAGHEVAALARSTIAADALKRLGAKPVAGDLDDPASLRAAFSTAQAECLLNVASMGFGHAPAVVAAAERAGIGRATFVSTTAVVTRVPAASRQTRLAGEDAVKRSSLRWTIIRPTMIYGAPGDRNISRLLAVVRRTPVLPVPGGGRHLQQPVHVEDLARAILAAGERPAAIGGTYDVAGPEPLAFRQLLVHSADAVGRRLRLVPLPLAACVVGLRVYETVARNPRLRAEQVLRLTEDKAFDVTAARTDLGFDPRPFAVGVCEEARLLWP